MMLNNFRQKQKFKYGDFVYKKGEVAKKMFIVKWGEFEIFDVKQRRDLTHLDKDQVSAEDRCS